MNDRAHHNIDADTAALFEHSEAILIPHGKAWNGPVRHDYQAGEVVWMWDHYNTAVIVGPGRNADTWRVTTQDADGSAHEYEYDAGSLRPAKGQCVFLFQTGEG